MKETYNGREIDYWIDNDDRYLEQFDRFGAIAFWSWYTSGCMAPNENTVCIWYAKGTPKPSITQS